MSRFSVTALPIQGLFRVQRQRIGDSRGFLSRLFCVDELRAAGWQHPVAQINHTYTAKRGTVRGMHFQHPPHAEMKLVSCVRGEVWDVAVDLRAGSPTFLHWHAEHLSEENGSALLMPEGCAHGFQSLTDEAELIYCHSMAYAPQAEGGLNPLDVRLGVSWPLEIAEMSARDSAHPMLDSQFKGLTL